MKKLTSKERLVTSVYGDTFSLYNEREFDDFKSFLERRLLANSIKPDSFAGKRCLDAGCGGGRASILMLEQGAREVVGVDLSSQNVKTCRSIAKSRGFKNASFVRHSLLKLPFPDESFDVVWSNGVLHHTRDPDRTLAEICRVLKVGGRMWLYLYGSGGIYWAMVQQVREFLRDVPMTQGLLHLRMQGVSVRRIAEFIDDWFVPYLRAYTDDDVQARLKGLGIGNIRRLMGGEVFDTSTRLRRGGREGNWMGGGDLRYWGKKTNQTIDRGVDKLPGRDGFGSTYADAKSVAVMAAEIRTLLQKASRNKSRGIAFRISVAHQVHMAVRSRLEQNRAFDAAGLRRELILLSKWVDAAR